MTDCERCGNRGWWLEDARVQVCPCERYEPQRWVRNGDTACILTHQYEENRPRRAAVGYLCAGHRAKLERLIAELPALYDDLGSALTSSEKPQDGGGQHKGPSTSIGLNLNEKVLEARREIHDELVRLVNEVKEARITTLYVKCPTCKAEPGLGCRADEEHRSRAGKAQLVRNRLTPTDSVNALAAWLTTQVDWLCTQPDVDETHGYLDRLYEHKSLKAPSGRRRFPIKNGVCRAALWCDVASREIHRCDGQLVAILMPYDDRESLSEVRCDLCGGEVPLKAAAIVAEDRWGVAS